MEEKFDKLSEWWKAKDAVTFTDLKKKEYFSGRDMYNTRR